jgi:hypothetical protein
VVLPRTRFLRRLLIFLVALAGGPGLREAAAAESGFPLRIAANQRQLEDSLGRPFLMNGDAAWSLMVELNTAQVETYLEDRRQKGFNTILVNLIERGFGGPANQNGDLPFVPADDFTSPNEAYFAHADQVIARAAEKGMLVLLTPAYLGFGCGSQGWCEQVLDHTVEEMRDYGRYLGARYAGYTNILWVHGGDTSALGQGALDHVTAIAEGILEMSPTVQLHTGHCSRNNSAVDCYDLPWLDVNNTYSACGDSLDAVHEDYDEDPVWPFFYIEGKYENENSTLACLIDQSAWSILGGTFGHVFGNNPIWKFGSGWENELSSPGSLAMAHLDDLYRSRAWFRLVPDWTGQYLTGNPGGDALAARTGDGETILVHVPDARTVSVDLGGIAGSQARGWWFDPSDGSTSDLGVFATAGGETDFVSPGQRLLVLDDAARNLPPPGVGLYPTPVDLPALGPPLRAAALALLVGIARLVPALRGRGRSRAADSLARAAGDRV